MDSKELNALYFESNFSSNKYDALTAFLSNSTETIDILYNNCYGGYRVSNEARKLYKEYTDNDYDDYKVLRHCPYVIKVFETVGSTQFGESHSQIESEKIPIYMEHYYTIEEYDGLESVHIKIEWFKYDMIQFVAKSIMNDTDKVKIINMIIDKKIHYD